MRFYEEIEWIMDHSKIRLQGRSRPVQMLKIELSLDTSDTAGIRMKEYIEVGRLHYLQTAYFWLGYFIATVISA